MLSKAYKVTNSEDETWFIEYRNPEWTEASVKCVMVKYLEHKIKFIELLIEAGYVEEK